MVGVEKKAKYLVSLALVAVVLVLMGWKDVSPVVGQAYSLAELQALAME